MLAHDCQPSGAVTKILVNQKFEWSRAKPQDAAQGHGQGVLLVCISGPRRARFRVLSIPPRPNAGAASRGLDCAGQDVAACGRLARDARWTQDTSAATLSGGVIEIGRAH